jgi:D-alanyl-D-alanine endopeptidase (penicillin-binding protein 7)
MVLVLLNSFGKLTPFGDANRVRSWLEQHADKVRPASARAPGDGGPPG